ncbi:MAG: hypothetical protein ACI8PD_002251, partial [Nitrospinales bacterium]
TLSLLMVVPPLLLLFFSKKTILQQRVRRFFKTPHTPEITITHSVMDSTAEIHVIVEEIQHGVNQLILSSKTNQSISEQEPN